MFFKRGLTNPLECAAAPPAVSTAYILMPFLTSMHTSIRTPSSCPGMKKRIWRILRHRGPARDAPRQEKCLHWRQGVLLLQQHGTCCGTGTVFPLPHKGYPFQRPSWKFRIPRNGIFWYWRECHPDAKQFQEDSYPPGKLQTFHWPGIRLWFYWILRFQEPDKWIRSF